MPWYEYRAIFVNEARIAAGTRFWTEHAATIQSTAERYGVAPEMLVAIVGVETYFGQRTGKYRVLDALATLAFAYPPRAKFFSVRSSSSSVLLTRRGGPRPEGAARLVRRRDGCGASSFRRASGPTRSTGTATANGDLERLGRRAAERRELLQEERLAGRATGGGSRHPYGSSWAVTSPGRSALELKETVGR